MKKVGLIALLLVFALGTMGVSYALWSDNLFINGTVETGSIDANWSVESVTDDETKEFSEMLVVGDGTKTLDITITNAYPCVTYTLAWDIDCGGSVPIHFEPPVIAQGFPGEFTFTDVSGVPIDWESVQLHPGDTMFGKLTVHLNNDAKEGATYTFSISLMFHQYNEEPPTP